MRPCSPRPSVVRPRVHLRNYDRPARRRHRVRVFVPTKWRADPALWRVEPALRYYNVVCACPLRAVVSPPASHRGADRSSRPAFVRRGEWLWCSWLPRLLPSSVRTTPLIRRYHKDAARCVPRGAAGHRCSTRQAWTGGPEARGKNGSSMRVAGGCAAHPEGGQRVCFKTNTV